MKYDTAIKMAKRAREVYEEAEGQIWDTYWEDAE